MATLIDKGEIRPADKNEKSDYTFETSSDFFAHPSNLIAGLSGTGMGRVLLGSKSTLQAISLVNRQPPLVQASALEGRDSVVKHLGKNFMALHSEVSGEVTKVNKEEIIIKTSSGDKTYELYNNFGLGQKTFVQHYPKVKVGDKVKPGDLLATTNYTDEHGTMALGTNLTTAVMPFRSGNFEDAIVVTQSGSEKLKAEQLFRVRLEERAGVEVNKNKFISVFANKFYNNQLATIGDNGVVKVGTIVKHGDPIILAVAPKVLKTTDIALGKLSSVLKHAFTDHSIAWDHEAPAEVVDVTSHNGLYSVNLRGERPLQTGDKLCMTPDHDVLTIKGWKSIYEVTAQDAVLTWNPISKTCEYLNPTTIPTYDHDGKMYCMEDMEVSMCVTPNHRLYAKTADSDDYRLIPAEYLFGLKYSLADWGYDDRPDLTQVSYLHELIPTNNRVEWYKEYTGKVYCLTFNRNHIFYVRRNGKCHWTGNSNVFGAKGVVTLIPDSHAPTTPDGKPVDVILNSMSVTSRVAPALIENIALAKLALKQGKPFNLLPFSKTSRLQDTIDLLKKHGIDDKETLYDPVSKNHMEVMVGPMYFTRLIHNSEDKESTRSQGVGYNWNQQPSKVEDESSKRVGNLSTNVLLSHGVTAVLKDIATIKSSKNDEYFRRLKLGQPVPSPQVPFVFNKFIANLQGSGIHVEKKDDKFHILPMTDKDINHLSSGEISEPLTFQVKHDKLVPEKGGLFDPEKTGALGERYTHVVLGQAIPNPISEDYLRKLLKVTKVQYEDLIVKDQIKDKLAAIDVDTKLAEYKRYLLTGKKTEREDSIKMMAFLKTLKENHIKPTDLILTKVPIIPSMYRPAMAQGDFSLSADINYLYKDLIHTAKTLKGDLTGIPQDKVDELKKKQYDAVKAVYGLGEPIVDKNKEKGLKGLLATTLGIHGGSAKYTLFQANVVNKPIDLVGRAVLTPSAHLGMDEAYIPINILWKTYSPFICRRLVQRGIPAVKAQEYIDSRNPLAKDALMEELKHRPGIISRDPALHKFNLTGFYLKPNADPKDTTIKLNPVVFKGFGADNDGDQLNVSIPVSEDARLEVIDKMLPSRNLLSQKTMGPMYTPSNESALGLYQMSTEDNHNAPKTFRDEKSVVDAFERGILKVGDRIRVG